MDHARHHGAPAPGQAAPKRLDDRDHAFLRSLGVPAAPTNVEAPQAGDDGAGRDRDQENRQPNFATVQAQAALAGCTLHGLPDGGYLVTRWSWCKSLAGLDAVDALLRRIGARV